MVFTGGCDWPAVLRLFATLNQPSKRTRAADHDAELIDAKINRRPRVTLQHSAKAANLATYERASLP